MKREFFIRHLVLFLIVFWINGQFFAETPIEAFNSALVSFLFYGYFYFIYWIWKTRDEHIIIIKIKRK